MKSSTWINLLVGIWLIIAPFGIRGATMAWTANDVIVGILLIAFSGWILGTAAPPAGAAWFEIVCGVWLIVAPFVLRYGLVAAAWNDVICGIIAIVFGVIGTRALTRTVVG